VSSMEAFQRAAAPALQVELPMASVMTSNPDPSVGEECWKTDLDTTVGDGDRSLPKAVAATWKVH
jgi:hypothetical protein